MGLETWTAGVASDQADLDNDGRHTLPSVRLLESFAS